MEHSPQLQQIMPRVLAGRTLREAAVEAGVSHVVLHRMRRIGRVPRRRTMHRIADGLRLGTRLRAEFFAAAGYTAPPPACPPAPGEAVMGVCGACWVEASEEEAAA